MSHHGPFNATPVIALAGTCLFLLQQVTLPPAAAAAQWAVLNNGIAYCMSEPEPAAPTLDTPAFNVTVWWKSAAIEVPKADRLTVSTEDKEILEQVPLRSDLVTRCPGEWRSLTGVSTNIAPTWGSPAAPTGINSGLSPVIANEPAPSASTEF